MRVVFLIRSFLYYTGQLANAMADQGHDVLILAAHHCGEFVGSAGGSDLHNQFREFLDPRVSLKWAYMPERTLPRTVVSNLKCIARLMKLITNYRPEVLHLHDAADYRIFFAAMLTRRAHKLVLTVHDAELHPGDSPNKIEFIRPWLRRMADGIIVHGEDIKRRLMEVSKTPEDRIYQAPIGGYLFYRKWLSDDDGAARRNVLFFGRVHKYKGLDVLIRSAPLVCRQVPEAKFVIAGEGPDWPRCKALIEHSESFVLHEGAVYDPDVARLFEEAAVVVLPYIEASQSGVLAIAYGMGKPVIVTDVGSLPEVVEDGGTGFIVPPNDVEALAKAIITILTDDELRERMSRNAYRRAVTDLSWAEAARRTAEAYAAVTARRAR